jgi:hypothetical protein
VHLAELHYEWNDLETAERLVREGIALAEQIAPTWNTTAYVTLADIRQARGDPADALTALEQARQLAAQSAGELDDELVAARAVRLALRHGDLALAQRLAAGRPTARLANPAARSVEALLTSVWAREAEGLIAARLELAQRQPARAREALAPLLRAAEARTQQPHRNTRRGGIGTPGRGRYGRSAKGPGPCTGAGGAGGTCAHLPG